jgi:rhomboid protease GluP
MAPKTETLLIFGAYRGDLFQAGAYWQAFTSGLCHIGVIHIAFNFIAISQMLPQFEEDLGPWITLLIGTLTQIGSTIADIFFLPGFITTAGASGVAFGLIGFGIAFYHRQG